MNRPLTILQVSTSDVAGGAERSARALHREYLKFGHDSWLAVGSKTETDPTVIEIPNEALRNGWVKAWTNVLTRYEAGSARFKGIGSLIRMARELGQPMRPIRRALGFEDHDYPGTRVIASLPSRVPDIVHLHNLHGGYFDLGHLRQLSRRIPTLLNLRDAWLLSGHCAFSFECQRWRTGCGACPDLTIFPAIRRDGTAHNWKTRKKIFDQSRVYVTTPSQWLMDRVNISIVSPAVIESRVIPNGVDTEVFCLGDRSSARRALHLDRDAIILLTAANGIRENIWKDYRMLKNAIALLAKREDSARILVLAVGESSPPEHIDGIKIMFVPFVGSSSQLALYYQAADVYLHTARIESFGNVLLEARACGTPVVSTSVGGIPEHVKSLAWNPSHDYQRIFSVADATGILTHEGDASAFAQAVAFLIDNACIRLRLGENGRNDVAVRFSLRRQAEQFLSWYEEIVCRGRIR